MKSVGLILCSAALLAGLCACKTQYDLILESNDVDVKYNAAFDYFNEGKYTKSAELFELKAHSRGMLEKFLEWLERSTDIIA